MNIVETPPSEVRTLRPVFLLAATIVAAFAILVTAFPISSGVLLLEAQTWASRNVGWYYLLAMTVYLVFVVGVALSGYGQVKLGADHDEPEFSYLSWAGMLFAAGISRASCARKMPSSSQANFCMRSHVGAAWVSHCGSALLEEWWLHGQTSRP